VPELPGIDRRRAEELVRPLLEVSNDVWLEPEQVRELLSAYGIPLVDERIAASVDEAVEAGAELGFPVVVKSAEAGAHKTESGGVALGLADAGAVRAAAERIGVPVLVQ